MSKITVNQTPSDQVAAEAQGAVVVTDARGRKITLKKPGILSQFRIVEIVGGELAKNQVYMSMILPLIYVAEIDGDPVLFPASKRELDALIQRLDEDGIETVAAEAREKFGRTDPQADKEAIKN